MEILSPWHLLIIGIIVLLLFGPKKLPDLARSLGEGIREFKKSMNEEFGEKKPETPAETSAPATK